VNYTASRSSRRYLRRLIALAGGTLLGLTAVLTLATPAFAHHSEVSGEAVCDTATGEWVVTWTVDSFAPDDVHRYKLVEVNLEPAGSTVTNIAETTDDSFPYEVGTPLVGEQRLPGTGAATSASLAVRAAWDNGFEEEKLADSTIEFGGSCVQDKPKPNATFESACDGSVTVTLTNAEDAKVPAEFTVTAGNFSKKVSVEPGDSAEVVVPAEFAADILVTAGDQKFTDSFTQPENCAPVHVASFSDCDSLTISIENPAGTTPVEATLTPKGGEAKTVTVAPGETKEVKFDAEEGTVVTLTIGDQSADIPWEKPDNCGGNAGGGPTLPVTGASTGIAVGIAAGLLAIGTALFFVFRRRRIRFTA
jgi:LPXTG-motif cell wall-anchored protein